jgi:hypothetical protein
MPGFTPKTWINGVDVANASNLQRYDDWIQQAEGDSGVLTLNGSTSGTVKLYQVMQGTFKKIILRANNFRNGGGSTQTITFPVAFTDGASIWTFDMPQLKLQVSGGDITTLYYVSGVGVGGFTTTQITAMTGTVLAHTQNTVQAIDTIAFPGSQGSASTGMAFIEGI